MRVALLLAATAILPLPAPAQGPTGTAALGWMAGCWERRAGATLVEEQWTAPRGGVLLGVGRTTRGDTLREWEATRIVDGPDGSLVYAATPSGQAPAEFRMARPASGGDAWRALAFENRAHDFPQVVRYRPQGRDSMVARVEGAGGARGDHFAYRRAPSSGDARAAAE
ncbi:DUF6265 family protein, partial [Roseisolibacter sp. H3M3-2]|uniref:DUF6265 family protein n=1 Tax=Roseisolibacter sp. H3M3-2 TaxID=3031323 RepID=UPI0023DAF669